MTTAADRLDAALARMLEERGERPPCAFDTDKFWFGRGSTYRAEAVRICNARCAVVDVCRAAAEELPARLQWGVWGGHDYTPGDPRRTPAPPVPPPGHEFAWMEEEA